MTASQINKEKQRDTQQGKRRRQTDTQRYKQTGRDSETQIYTWQNRDLQDAERHTETKIYRHDKQPHRETSTQ